MKALNKIDVRPVVQRRQHRAAGRNFIAVHAIAIVLVLAACSAPDKANQAMDRLEQAIVKAEAARPLDADSRNDAAMALREAYGPVLALDTAGLSDSQEGRRESLRHRAIVAAADLIDLMLPETAQ